MRKVLGAWYFFIISVQQTNPLASYVVPTKTSKKRNVTTTHIHQHAGEQSLFAESSKHFNVCLFVCILETLFQSLDVVGLIFTINES
jgi:hypothetical protein